ncbi:MAG: hypothetical protein QXN22_03360 [Thermofilaceae archaeon]
MIKGSLLAGDLTIAVFAQANSSLDQIFACSTRIPYPKSQAIVMFSTS